MGTVESTNGITTTVIVDKHNGETKIVTQQSLLDDRTRTGFSVGDSVTIHDKDGDKLWSATIYSVNESDLEVRWDDGDTSNRLHPFDVPTLVNKDDDDQDIQQEQQEEEIEKRKRKRKKNLYQTYMMKILVIMLMMH